LSRVLPLGYFSGSWYLLFVEFACHGLVFVERRNQPLPFA
jgi:hypothetical protein